MSNFPELFVKLGFKSEGADQLKAFEDSLKNIAATAKEAVAQINKLSGIKIKMPEAVSGDANVAPAKKDSTKNQEIAERREVAAIIERQKNQKAADRRAEEAAQKRAESNSKQGLKKIEEVAKKVALALGAVAAGMLVLINRALANAMAVNNFASATGLAADQLQRMQYNMELAGASGEEMLATLKGLQRMQAQIALGEGDLSAFSFFGVGTNEDPAEVIKKVSAAIKNLRKDQLGVGREMASRMGISDDMFAAMRRGGSASGWGTTMTATQLKSMEDLNYAMRDLIVTLTRVKDKIVATLAPVIEIAATVGAFILKVVGVILDLLNADNPVSKFIKWIVSAIGALVLLVAGAGALVVGFSAVALSAYNLAVALNAAAVAAGAKGASDAGGLFGKIGGFLKGIWPILLRYLTPIIVAVKWLGGILSTLVGGISASVGWIIAAAAAVALVFDDLYEALSGGESYIRDFVDWIESITDGFLKASTMLQAIKGVVSSLFGPLGWILPDAKMQDSALTVPSGRGAPVSGGDTTVTNSINIDGSRSPEATAEAVNRKLQRSYSDTVHAMPAVSY